LEDYKETILNTSGVKSVKDIKARNYGSIPVVDVVILVNSTLGVGAAHDITNAQLHEHHQLNHNLQYLLLCYSKLHEHDQVHFLMPQ